MIEVNLNAVHDGLAENRQRNEPTLNQPNSYSEQPPERPVGKALYHGWRSMCPACGEGSLFSNYLGVKNECGKCGLQLHHHRADDAPPYFTIFITAHVVVPALIVIEQIANPALWVQMTVGLTLTAGLALLLLPRVKGMTIGLQWAKYMHGFGEASDSAHGSGRPGDA